MAAQTYGTAGGRTVRVVAARSDLTGKVDLTMTVDHGQAVGDDFCTQNVRLVANGPVGIRSTVALCWHTSADLTVYTLLVDPKHNVTTAESAKALDEVWDQIS
jgi:hypothetical protein